MRIVQITLMKVLAALALVGGIATAIVWLDPALWDKVHNFLLASVWPRYGLVLGVLATIAGFAGLVPLLGPKRKKTISFQGTHGEVTIELDSIEATLSRVVGKMPEVKKISVTVTPSEDNRQAQVFANVLMYKGAETAGARQIANRISDYLADTAVNILGVEDITKINLNIRGIIIDAVKPKAASGAILAEPLSSHEAIATDVSFENQADNPAISSRDPFADSHGVAGGLGGRESTSFEAIGRDLPVEAEETKDTTA